MNDPLAAIELEPANGSLLVRLTGEIDLSNADRVHRELESAIEGWPALVVDLSGIEYLDSQGLRLIKQLCTRAGREGTKLQLVAPPASPARQVLDMARMSDYTEIRDTLEP